MAQTKLQADGRPTIKRKKAVASVALSHYRLEDARLTLLGSAVNAVFRVDSLPDASPTIDRQGQRRFVLRVYPPSAASATTSST